MTTIAKESLDQLLDEYDLDSEVQELKPFGSGHIHDTYLLTTNLKAKIILQKVNNMVFKNVPEMMENIERVTAHLRKKLMETPGSDPDKESLKLLYTKNGKTFLQDKKGMYWRMFHFIEPHQTFDIADDPAKVEEAGKAYGKFIFLLSDLEGEALHETIPEFHNIEMRINKFNDSLLHGNKSRIQEAPEEINLILELAEEMKLLSRLQKEGMIPVRITHNDTKINNILFSPEGKAMCVIDLDTVMPGLVHYDFGDAIRTFANTAAEDEKDLSKVSLNLKYFESFAKGYLSVTNTMLSEEEKRHLAFSARYFTYLHVLRFLTDYFQNDIYYKTHYPGHNLVRARNQKALLKSMDLNYDTMQKIIRRLS